MSSRQQNKNTSRHRIHADKSTGAAEFGRALGRVAKPTIPAIITPAPKSEQETPTEPTETA